MHIDWWTLALQAVNVLILVWLLGRFFFRPLAAMIEKRQAEAAALLSDATAARDIAARERAEAEAASADLVAGRDRMMEEARKAAAAECDAMLEGARAKIASMQTADAAAQKRDRLTLERELAVRAGRLALDIARRVLEKQSSAAYPEGFVAPLVARIGELPATSRALLVGAAANGGLTLTSATSIDSAAQARCRTAVEQALSAKVVLAFRTDPTLIAGVELTGGAIVISNNWRDDLSRIGESFSSNVGQTELS